MLASVLVILPSILSGIYLSENSVPVQYAYFVACTVLLLAALDFATVVFIEQYRSRLGALTMPALLATIAVIFLFIIAESLIRFFEHLGYTFITPVVIAAMLMIYAAIFMEKNMMLKSYLSINSIALALLWAMGASDKITMPF